MSEQPKTLKQILDRDFGLETSLCANILADIKEWITQKLQPLLDEEKDPFFGKATSMDEVHCAIVNEYEELLEELK